MNRALLCVLAAVSVSSAAQAQVRRSYNDLHQLGFSWELVEQTVPPTSLNYVSGSWSSSMSGRAFRGGADLPGSCGECFCSYVTARADGPVISQAHTTGAEFFRDEGTLPYDGGYWTGQSYPTGTTGSWVYFQIDPGILEATFNAIGEGTIARYYPAYEYCDLLNSSGSSWMQNCFGHCSDPYGRYMDWCTGCQGVHERFVMAFDDPGSDVTLTLHLYASIANFGQSFDYFHCETISCLDTPPMLTTVTNETVVVSAYKALPPTQDPPRPVFGGLLGSTTQTGTVTTTGHSITGTGLFAGLTCSCPVTEVYDNECGPEPFLEGTIWNPAPNQTINVPIPLSTLTGTGSRGGVIIVIDRVVSMGNSCSDVAAQNDDN
jgi:hypothetical protein